MQYTNLGRAGLQVSRLCLGTMNFGPQTTEEASFAIMDKVLDLGINFFDTANVYGWKKGENPTDVALVWLLQNPVVIGPIIGPHTLDQLEGSLHALEIELDEIFPGPGSTAPEAYAW